MFTPQYKSTKSSGRVERLAQEHDTMNRPGFAFALLLQRSSAYYTHQTRILRRPFPSPQQHQELLLIATVTYFSLPPPMPVFTGIYAHISERFQLEILNFINRTEKPLPRKFQSSTSSLTVIFVAPMGTSKTVQLPKSINGENNFLGYMTTKGMWINQESTTEPILITASPYP